MDSGKVLTLPKNPLSHIFLKYYSKREIKDMKDSFKEKLLQTYFSPFDFDYSKYESLLSKHLDNFGLFKGLFAELYVREWFFRTQNFSLEEKVNETVIFSTNGGVYRKLNYKTLNLGVIVRRTYDRRKRKNSNVKNIFTEIDILGSYSNGFEASFFTEVKSGAKNDYSYMHVRRGIYTALLYSHKNSIPLFEHPVFYFYVHGNYYIKNPNSITKRHYRVLRSLEEQYGNLVIVEFPLNDMKKASLEAWRKLREKYHYKVKSFEDYSYFRGVIFNS